MVQQTAERAGTERAEDNITAPTLRAAPLYGPGGLSDCNPRVYPSDASARWEVEKHREELIVAGALAIFRGRLFRIEPTFSNMMLEFGRAAIGHRAVERQRAAQAAADAAVAARAATIVE